MKKFAIGMMIASVATLAMADGAAVYKKCQSCHGANGGEKALGRSAVITGWDSAKTEAALIGYKDGSYGGPMKALMKGQVASLSAGDIKAVSDYIAAMK